ncbi:SPFH domain-containing protein [Hyphomicrobium facile]|uniref:Regulator of protease activity HflC, stomatin/prohibitin superfamily n=1 Tax=Hyphomicrobium facile TaxID=51670 RepID=A0A1I7NTW2_9HYPH|nr:SPFH domain-containing protein [Hyphomicrobium facile]SFV38101.1 Regulator of protease activity HflC, stomatin/prohibitin superfamily [Hyphomicrobium facile]
MTTVVLSILAICLFVIFLSLKIVPQTENWLVERMGRYSRTLSAGVHIVTPFIDRIAHKENILERQLPVKSVPSITKDNVQIEIKLAILYRVTDASRAWYRIKNIDQAIETIITGIVRSTIGNSDLDDVQSNRRVLSDTIEAEIQHVTEEWGIVLTRVEILDVEVDAETRTAMQLQLNAERTRRALVREAEGKKQAANLNADAELYTAQQQAQAQRVLADAQAYTVKTIAEAINNGGEAAINFDIKKIQAEAVKTLGSQPSTKVILLPSDLLETLSSVASKLVLK